MVPDVRHADGLGCTAEIPQIPDQFTAAPNGVSLVPESDIGQRITSPPAQSNSHATTPCHRARVVATLLCLQLATERTDCSELSPRYTISELRSRVSARRARIQELKHDRPIG